MAISPQDLGPRAAAHLLNRAGFGPRPGQIHEVLERGLERYVREQLEPAPDPALEQRLARFPTLSYPTSRVLSLYEADPRSTAVILDEFASAKVVRAVHSANQLQEALVDFWFNHFNVFVADGFARYSISSYERDAIRPHVLGRFPDLLGAVTTHPAMLFYLDNYLSTVERTVGGRKTGGLNENHGRELLELHTVGVDAGYTQADVIDAARCLTGFGIDNLRTGGNFLFRAANHDPGSKQVFGLSVPAGGGREDGDRLLDHLASHPAAARFISRALAERFSSDTPAPALVDTMADRFLRTDGDLREVMQALFGSTEFWAEAFGPGKFKTPLELVASALRAMDAEVTNTRAITGALANMGLPLYACNPPTGYSNRGADWINPSSQLYRMNFALDLAAGALPGVGVDVQAVVRAAGGDPESASSVAQVISSQVFGRSMSRGSVDAARRVTTGGPVSVAVRTVGLLLAGPDMQVR